MSKLRHYLVAIAGGSGAGKTTVAGLIAARFRRLEPVVLDLDSYYRDLSHLAEGARHSINFDHPDAVDHDLLLAHLRHLIHGEPVDKPVYSFTTHTRTSATQRLIPSPLILVEGLFALWEPRLRTLADLKIYVDIAADIRLTRRLQRDTVERGRAPEDVVRQYLQQVQPAHTRYVEPTRAYADIVVQGDTFPSEIAPLYARLDDALGAPTATGLSASETFPSSAAPIKSHAEAAQP